MRRTHRRAAVNLALFAIALFLILALNYQSSSSKTFAWTTVRYKTSAATLPKNRGTCPGLNETSKPALVVSRVAADGNPTWLDHLEAKYHICTYAVDAPSDDPTSELRVPANKGHEAMAYLTFIIDNYNSIPEAGAVFVHGSRFAWHNDSPDYDNAVLLTDLNVTAALAPVGYHNMRCDWSASTCPAEAKAQGSLETQMNAVLEPFNARVVSDAALPKALVHLFGGQGSSESRHSGEETGRQVVLGRADTIRSQCCAQFVVARDNIWRHSREEYVALRQWLLDDTAESAPPDDRTSGRILSYVWHILFLPPHTYSPRASDQGVVGVDLDRLNRMACPSAEECYCRLYGRCNVKGCGEGFCQGQYAVPPEYKLPADWEATHGSIVPVAEQHVLHDSLRRDDGSLTI